ncbi:solute carrier family 35 member F2-like [Littorina saxatilis]|uniref:Solute carrier family 35 member F1 n=1 Tax=Littorina saxatilis TaxID=31220 RepID=A0AAN9GHL3_9CAEN
MSTYEHIGPDSDDEEAFPTVQRPDPESERLLAFKSKTQGVVARIKLLFCSREFLKALLLGQMVSLFLCGTAVFSGLLQKEGVHTPTAQSFLNYVLLCVVFTVMLACRRDTEGRHLGIMLRQDGWKYAILALIDVEANYLVVKAYSYTTITSVQVLDCFSIVVVMVLSRWLLKTRYGWLHLVGVGVSLGGLAGLVVADVTSGRNDDDTGGSNRALGDFLVIGGAALYGVSNVGQEFVVKHFPRVDFLGMIGLFGSFISGVQFILLERDEVAKLDLSSSKIWVPWLGYVACLFLIYVTMTLAIQQTSATTVNISILTADFYALLFGLFLFHYQFQVLYIVAFFLVMLGIAIYSARPVESACQEIQTSSPPHGAQHPQIVSASQDSSPEPR